jgi:indole-3-glycerol phosphate synthase
LVLDEILAARRRDVAEARRVRTLARVRPRAAALRHRLRAALEAPGVGLICEIKKASPSRGPIAPDLDVADRARAYERAGARAISVLTEPHFFAGSLADLEAVAGALAAPIPILRKDFIVDEYQILETAASPAAAVLLIVAALDRRELLDFLAAAGALGLDCLVEVHTEAELDLALESGAVLVGVNNRDLKTLTVDLSVSERLIPRIPGSRIAVAESGFSRPEEVARLAGLGARAFLVGESLMTDPRPEAKVRELLSGVTGPSFGRARSSS